MDLFLWQFLFIISIFVTVMVCCLIPILILSRTAYRTADGASFTNEFCTRLLSWFNCLTGGVFLAMCFLGLLPNVHKQMMAVLDQMGWDSELPLAEVIVLLGFFIVLAVDQASRLCEGKTSDTARPVRKLEMSSMGLSNTHGEDDAQRTLLADDGDWDDDDEEEIVAPGNVQPSPAAPQEDDVSNRQGKDVGVLTKYATAAIHSKNGSTSNAGVALTGGGHGHSHDQVIGLLTDSAPRGVRFFVLLFALSTHALFEGIVLGLQREKAAAIHLFTAIVLHEAVVAATLGFSIAKARHSVWTAVRYSLLFGATIPVGIGLGMAIGQTPGIAGHLISGGLQGVAAGIFLHITFMQLLPDEFSRGRDGLVKTLFLFIGFLLLLTLNLALGGEHH